MSHSRRELYVAGEPFGDSCTRLEAGRLICGGGGGKSSAPKNYANLETLYGEQAASARLLRNIAEQNLPSSVRGYMGAVNRVMDPGYAENQAARAASDATAASAAERAATERSLSSMGVNPNDPRFAGSMRSTNLSNAAMTAASKNAARNDALEYQRAVAQDAVGTFTGQSNHAATQMASATSGMANIANMQQQAQMNQQAQRQQGIANAVGGGMALYSMFKDGGKVKRPAGLGMYMKGGKVKTLERHFMGGMSGSQQQGFLSPSVPQPPQQMQQPQQQQVDYSPVTRGLRMMKDSKGREGTFMDRMKMRGAEHTDKIGRMVGKVAPETGANISAQAAGARMAGSPAQVGAARDAYAAAAQQAQAAGDMAGAQQYMNLAANISDGAGLGKTVTAGAEAANALGAAATGAEAAGAAAAGANAAGAAAAGAEVAGAASALTGTASAGAGALATVGAALPWVGAAAAVGSLLGLFKDGGKIEKIGNAYNLDAGGKVPGRWEGNTDTVPALLTEEEYVLPAESVALVGEEQLEEIRQKGLELRERGLTPDKIRGLRFVRKEVEVI